MMKKLLALVLMLALLHRFAAADSGQPLSLLLQSAETHYVDFNVEKLQHEANAQAAPIARAALFPQVSALLQENHDAENNDSWSASISVEQVLYNLPQWQQWRAAQEQTKRSDFNLAAARQNLRQEVIIAWLDVQLAVETLLLVKARRKTLQEQLKRTETLAASGQVIEADVLSARAGLATARSQLAQAEHDLEVAHDAVIRYAEVGAVNMQLDRDIKLLPLPPLAEWQEQLEKNNLELKTARQQAVYTEGRLKIAAGSVYPRLSFSGSWRAKDSTDEVDTLWQLSLRQSLFTGGQLRAQERQLTAEVGVAHEQRAALQSRHTQTLKRLYGQMRADLARIEALSEATASAAAFLEVVVVGYDNGINIITEVLSAEEAVFDAQLNLQQAYYSYLKNLTRIKTLLAVNNEIFAAQVEDFFIPAATDGKE